MNNLQGKFFDYMPHKEKGRKNRIYVGRFRRGRGPHKAFSFSSFRWGWVIATPFQSDIGRNFNLIFYTVWPLEALDKWIFIYDALTSPKYIDYLKVRLNIYCDFKLKQPLMFTQREFYIFIVPICFVNFYMVLVGPFILLLNTLNWIFTVREEVLGATRGDPRQ